MVHLLNHSGWEEVLGNPLSPLFVLVAKVLNKMLQKAAQIGMIEGLSVGTRGVELTHLQFADDTLSSVKQSCNS